MIKHSAVLFEYDNPGSMFFYCPGCKMRHVIYVESDLNRRLNHPTWAFDGNHQFPTFSPSLLVRYNWGPDQHAVVCHSFIRNGQIQYLNDCTHDLKGQTVDLPDLEKAEAEEDALYPDA